jgi:hypothetical protein
MLTVPEAVVKQMSDDPPTEKAASAENRDEPAMVGCAVCEVFCHGHEPATPWHDLSIPGFWVVVWLMGRIGCLLAMPLTTTAPYQAGLPSLPHGIFIMSEISG